AGIHEYEALLKVKKAIETDQSIKDIDFTVEERKQIKNMNLLSLKPNLYIANLAETDLANPENNDYFKALKSKAHGSGIDVIPISAQVEFEIAALDKDEQLVFLDAYGLGQSGLDSVIQKGYELLGLKTYFTCGPMEVRAWTFPIGTKA